MNFTRPKVPVDRLSTGPEWPEPGRATLGRVSEPLTDVAEPEGSELVVADQPEPPDRRTEPTLVADLLRRAKDAFNLWNGLGIMLLGFYALAGFTAYMTGQERPGQLIFSNTMTQLWTAAFRLTFVLGTSLGILRLFWPELFRFFWPDTTDGPDMIHTIRFELTPFQRICVFLVAFFGICALFVALLWVNLPQTISVGR